MSGEVVLLAGTRPEAVKLAPVAVALAERSRLTPVIVHSGQHPGMVEQALAPFGLVPDERLAVLRSAGGQAELFSALLPELDEVLARRVPAAVLVQGDTATTLAGALAAFWRGVPVVHLEAGLRTGNLAAPFPEEGNRQLVSRIASLHLAPTERAVEALRREQVPHRRIVLTRNTVVDAVRAIAARDLPAGSEDLARLESVLDRSGGRLLLATVHRRESWGPQLDAVLAGVLRVVAAHPDVHALVPAHPNPSVRARVHAALDGHERVVVADPLGYPDLVRALRRSSLVVTDSGGIQEEAPTFGVPVLVARDTTERVEAVEAGCAFLVGADEERIVAAAARLLRRGRSVPCGENPYGDGNAGTRAAAAIEELVRYGHSGGAQLGDGPANAGLADTRGHR